MRKACQLLFLLAEKLVSLLGGGGGGGGGGDLD